MLIGTCHCGNASWNLKKDVESVSACNCTMCRRYGALWAYGHENEDAQMTGDLSRYEREDMDDRVIQFLFCPRCACVLGWRTLHADKDGRYQLGVNLRLASPEAVAAIPVRRFDGLESFKKQPADGRCVSDIWF